MENYIIRSIDANGHESFYNGKAGAAWISDNRADAFRYQTKEAAQRKALMFNKMTAIHGLRFIALMD